MKLHDNTAPADNKTHFIIIFIETDNFNRFKVLLVVSLPIVTI